MKLTQQMKSHSVIIALIAEHGDLVIANFLKIVLSLAVKVHKEMEITSGDSTEVAKHKTVVKRPNIIKHPHFVLKAQKTIDKNSENQLISSCFQRIFA